MSSIEAVEQRQESLYVKAVAGEIIRKAGAEDNRARVIALRDYLREHVTFQGAPYDHRPLMRATAAETLRSGKGYCGEVTRAFILLANEAGIKAHRIYLYSRNVEDDHVVAEAELSPGEWAIVDGQNPPHIRDLEPLDQVILRPEYIDYSTLQLRERRLNRLVSRMRLELGPLIYWLEAPHALKSALWLVLALASLIGPPLFAKGRSLKTTLPMKNGWVRVPVLTLDPSQIDRLCKETARSFDFEWSRFPEMRAEWERNFWDYMAPHTPESFYSKRVLDAGCGGGRHAHYAAKNGAEVWAVDLGSAVEVAKANNRSLDNVRVVQADIHHLPFEPESFDLVYSIGVLHHLPDPESAFRNLLRYVKPGGWIQIYLYWKPENQPVKRALLSLVTAARRVTTRIPHELLYGLSFLVAAIVFAGFVWPYQLLLAAGLRGIAERMPMKQYAKYPFRVCVNDQFDRLSAPIEFRYTRKEVEEWMRRAELEEIVIRPNYGWCATGRKPART